ncbi:MAG: HAD family hydrolase [Terriglobales bacterium]
MIEAIIFDMDGVVIDSHPIHRRSWRLFLQSLGKEVSDIELDFVMEGSKREDILRHFLGSLTEFQLKQYGSQKEALFREQVTGIRPMPGFLDFIRGVTSQGMRAALASSGSEHRVSYILDHLDIRHYFSAIVSGDDVKNGKPDPTVFLIAAQRLGVAPSDAVVFEDAIAGVKGAKAAGMRCFALAKGARCELLQQAGADQVIRNFVGLTMDSVTSLLSDPLARGVSNLAS